MTLFWSLISLIYIFSLFLFVRNIYSEKLDITEKKKEKSLQAYHLPKLNSEELKFQMKPLQTMSGSYY